MENPHITTYTHELALGIIFESGIQHMADAVNGYMSLPDTIKDFLRKIPVVWNETKLISGYPGRDIIIARRNGKKWYIAAINGESFKKDFFIDISYVYNLFSIVIWNSR